MLTWIDKSTKTTRKPSEDVAHDGKAFFSFFPSSVVKLKSSVFASASHGHLHAARGQAARYDQQDDSGNQVLFQKIIIKHKHSRSEQKHRPESVCVVQVFRNVRRKRAGSGGRR